MMIAKLKTEGTLQNALKSLRPMMQAKANQRRNNGKEQSINRLLDFQFFIENDGEGIIDAAVSNFVSDEAVFLFSQWVKETQIIHDVRVLPGLDPNQDEISQLLMHLQDIFPTQIAQAMKDEDGYRWEVTFEDDNKDLRTAEVCFYDTDDGKIEAAIVKPAITHDGPVVRVLDFEDVSFPVRSENLQPPSPSNPNGAPYFDISFTVNIDTIKRRVADHTYDLVTDEDMEKIEQSVSSAGSDSDQDLEKQQKDEHEGVIVSSAGREDREGVMRFGRFDVNGDGLDEDVIVWLLLDSKIVVKAALLTEIYPGLPIRRPISHQSFIPTPNRVYGMSQDELLEALQDMNQVLMNQHIDWGTLTNTPFFVYRLSSGMKDEKILIEPGMGLGLDNPQTDFQIPVWPQKDSTYALNTMTLLQQFVQDIRGFSDMSASGRVPAGKASAMRNVGTTTALLAQADVRSEQVLRRLFSAFKGVFAMMHRLDRRYLPDKKEIRILGQDAQGEDAYTEVERKELDAEVDFEFKATLMNTNKEALALALEKAIALTFTPLAMQMGVFTVEKGYNLLRDEYKALDLDPDLYIQRPPDPMPGPKLLAEEIISMILANEMPQGGPLEAPQEHLMKLAQFMQSDNFGFMNVTQAQILKQWMLQVQQMMLQQQMMMQAMGQFAGEGKPGGGGNGAQSAGNATGAMANPMVGPNQLLDESIGGEVPQ